MGSSPAVAAASDSARAAPFSGLVHDGARLAALHDSGLLDSDPDPMLDRLTRLATTLIGVPVSLISLVDVDRQFLLSERGVAEPWAGARETPLSHSICRHVVDRGQTLVIEDAGRHPLVSDNLGVRDLDVRAYAGAPVQLADGQTLGAFCAIDKQPRTWKDHEIVALEDLAGLASEILGLRTASGTPALRDRLTGLADRKLLTELLETELATVRRTGVPLACVALGLDGFALVNEALGHEAGDHLIVGVAERLAVAARAGHTVGRLGGDEFMVICPGLDSREVKAEARRLREAIVSLPHPVKTREVMLGASVACHSASPAASAEETIEAALNRLSSIKRRRSGTPPMDVERRAVASRSLLLRSALRGAVEREELQLAFQPVRDLATGALRGCEALLRWRHPALGSVPPNEFIPVAEASGDIVAIGEWVLESALAELARWRAMDPERDLRMLVNVAAVELRSAVYAKGVARRLEAAGVPPGALVLELTERLLLDDHPVPHRTIGQLRGLGVDLALDDFGTGYSALSHLARFPIDILKIDRDFIAPIPSDRRAADLLAAIVAMADSLGMKTIAEGIEEEEQLRAVRSLGATMGQGYHLARPVAAQEITALLTG